MPLSLGDVLVQRDLGLRPLCGSPQTRRRTVHGAHGMEIERPTRWLGPHWIMLTNGLRLRGHPARQRALITELDEHGAAALGWAVGTVTAKVPQAILAEARARDFCVFEVPWETTFQDVVAFVTGSLASTEISALRRTHSMTDYLMDAAHAAEPVEEVAQRLAALLDAPVLVLSSAGRPLAVTAPMPIAAIAALALEGAGGDRELEVEGHRVLLHAVRSGSGDPSWVAVVASGRGPERRVARQLVGAAGRLLAVIASADALGERRTRALRTELLDAALEGADPGRVEGAAAVLGLDLATPAHVVALGGDAAELLGTVETALRHREIAHLSTSRGPTPLILAQATADELEALLEGALRGHDGAAAGIGRPLQSLAGAAAARSAADARHALRTGEHRSTVRRFDALDGATWLLSAGDPAEVQERVGGLLDPLLDDETLLGTLRCHFDARLNASEASRRLNLHRNSFLYRLSQIERRLGVDLTAPADIARVHLALLARGLEDHAPG
jgi:purine catabolism regulator